MDVARVVAGWGRMVVAGWGRGLPTAVLMYYTTTTTTTTTIATIILIYYTHNTYIKCMIYA